MRQDIVKYYHERANEYEKVYLNPAEQTDLQEATSLFQRLFANKSVLEIACGTGYWTERIAQTASEVLATDANQSMVDIARKRSMPDHVTLAVADMFEITPDKKYDVVFGGFIWSHIFLHDLDRLIQRLKSCLLPGGMIVMIDGRMVENTNHDKKRIIHTDETGNTYQNRILENGDSYLVLKNFPTRDFIRQKLSPIATEVSFVDTTYYWIAYGVVS